MKKGIKKGALVTYFNWMSGHREYGRIRKYLGGDLWSVYVDYKSKSSMGVPTKHIRPVKERKKK